MKDSYDEAANAIEAERQQLIAALNDKQQIEYGKFLEKQENDLNELKKKQQDRLRDDVDKKKRQHENVGKKTYLRPQNRPSENVRAPLSEDKITEIAREKVLYENIDKIKEFKESQKTKEMDFLRQCEKDRKKERFMETFQKVSNQIEKTNDKDLNNENNR